MSERREVRRLAEDDATVREALAALRQSVEPDADAVARLQARVEERVGLPQRARPRLTLVKVAGGAGVIALLIALLFTMERPAAEPAAQKAVVEQLPRASAPPEPAPIVRELAPAEDANAESASALPAPVAAPGALAKPARRALRAAVRPVASPHSVASASAAFAPESVESQTAPTVAPIVSTVQPHEEAEQKPRPTAEDEAHLLSRARKSLRSDPSTTLALADEHRSRFPAGTLAPERERLAIAALRALGRSAEAEARERTMRTSFPNATYAR